MEVDRNAPPDSKRGKISQFLIALGLFPIGVIHKESVYYIYMAELTFEDIKISLNLSTSKNIYFSYEYPKAQIRETRLSNSLIIPWEFFLSMESDYGLIQLNSKTIDLNYVIGKVLTPNFRIIGQNYFLEDNHHTVFMRKYLRYKAQPIIDFLLEMGYENEESVEDFMLLKKNSLHFTKISQEEKETELKQKAEEEKALRLKQYILITDDSVNIGSSDIRKFQALSRSSNIVITLGTEEFKVTNETLGYIEFIPTMFNDSIRVAFLLCESDKFDDYLKLMNTTNRILRFMLPIHEILRKDFTIDTETVLSVAKGEITGPIIINRTTPLNNVAGISKEILQPSDLANELFIEPVDMVIVSCKDNIWELSFSDGRLLRIDSQGQKEHSLNVVKHELLNHGYFIHEPAFDNYMKKADFSKNLYFKKNRLTG